MEWLAVGLDCCGLPGGAHPRRCLGFFVLAFQAGWRRIELHNVVIRKC